MSKVLRFLRSRPVIDIVVAMLLALAKGLTGSRPPSKKK